MKAAYLLIALVLAGCEGSPEPAVEAAPVAAAVFPGGLVEAAWPVRMAVDAARAPYEGHPGWGQLFMRQHPEALASFLAEPQLKAGAARIHADHAALYRQAALLAAQATRHVYGGDRLPEDPAPVDYLLGEAMAVLGDCAGTSATLAKATGLSGDLSPRLTAWTTWAASPACPGDLGLVHAAPFPGLNAPSDAMGVAAPPPAPHYQFPLEAGGVNLEAIELSTLVALSDWHLDQARTLVGPEKVDQVELHLAPWRLPGEKAPTFASPPVRDDDWLFGSFVMSPEDALFLVDARATGVAAIEVWKEKSLYAAALAPAVEAGKLSPERVLDQAADLGASLKAAMVKSAGEERDFFRPFTEFAVQGLLRAGSIVADGSGEYRDAGILRINAFERANGPTIDPVFSISLAAWDAGNRSPLRAQEIIHSHLPRFPALSVARYPLDALHLRLGRTAGPAIPVQ